MEVKPFMNSIDFGSRLKSIRYSRKLTQSKLSKKLNISRQAYANYEQGRCIPTINILIELSFLLNYNLLTLFIPDRDINSSSSDFSSAANITETEISLIVALYQKLTTDDRLSLVVDMLMKLDRT